MMNMRNIGTAAGLGAGLLLLPAFGMDYFAPSVMRFGRLGFDSVPAAPVTETSDGPVVRFGKLGFDSVPAAAPLADAMYVAFSDGNVSSPESTPILEPLQEATASQQVALGKDSERAPFGAGLPEPLANGELNALRGGYISAGGYQFDFGVKLQTFVDGTLALASTLTLSDQGLAETRSANVPGAVPLSEAATRLPNLANIAGDGLVLEGNGGVTVLVQDLSLSSIRNLVVNTANDRNIVQNAAVTLVVPNLQDLTQASSFNDLMSSLNQALDFGLLNSAGR
jgi:hypothetical protein